ncbi:MAG: winged helix-turn-helix transcriptional regulator [Roseovarius sp.]|uniref:winged helix-turn-helix transcriptional regulator n=1 Tax=Roseovarius sp. TaxID=1486281 RepID=UPI0032EBA6F7
MSNKSYDDGCAAAHAMDLVGNRWALLIARELMFGPKRFTDLRSDLRNVSPNVLTQRLEDLETARILRRRQLPPPAASWVYELTEWGRELEEPILSLGRWAARSPFLQQDLPMTRAGLLMALRAMYRPGTEGGFCIDLGLPHGTVRVTGTATELRLDQAPTTPETPDAVLAGTVDALDGLLFGNTDLSHAVANGDIDCQGDRDAIDRFLQAFPLPPTAA